MSAELELPVNEKRRRAVIETAKRKKIAERDGWSCHYCAISGDKFGGPDGHGWHIDHKHPWSQGGSDDLSNLVLACRSCNLQKSDTPYEVFIHSAFDIGRLVLHEFEPFQDLIISDRGSSVHGSEVVKMNASIDMEHWEVIARVPSDEGRNVLLDLLRAVRRIYVLAKKSDGIA